jgi:hypothetical protein
MAQVHNLITKVLCQGFETKHGTEDIKPREVHILIATDVASRGTDIEDVT